MLLSAHEPARLAALAGYHIVGSGREGAFEELVVIARNRFAAPISAISFVDERRWYPKAISGFARCSLPRTATFCDHTIAGDDLLEVPDARDDARFRALPIVDGGPHVRFYAGVPLHDSLGYALGTFSILDERPRQLPAADQAALREFARLAVRLVELRRAVRAAESDRAEVERLARALSLLEALLSAVSEAADLPTALVETGRRIADLTGWRARAVWRPGDLAPDSLSERAARERRALSAGGVAAIPVVADDELLAVLAFDVAGRISHRSRDVRGGRGGEQPGGLLAAVAAVVQPLAALVRRRRIEEALRLSEGKLRSVTNSARDGIFSVARDGSIVYANPAARTMFGRDELRGLPLPRLVDGFAFDQLEGGAPMERWAVHASGRRFPVELSCAEWALDPSGYATAIVRDVSERFTAQAEAEVAQRRLAFLFRATSELLEQPLATDALLATIARLVLPQLGDLCIVDLAERDEHVRHVACAPGRAFEAAALDDSRAFSAQGDSLVGHVMRSGEPFLFSPGDGAQGAALDLATAHHWSRAGWRACLIVPLVARERTAGAITLVSFTRGYTKDDLALAQELGHRVALAVDNAHLYAEARAAVRVRDDVLAIVSHDLRTPLSTILTSTSRVLQMIEDTETPARAPLERCQRAARRMSHMIRDLLDAASLETGTLSLDQKTTVLSHVLSDAADLLQPLAEARGLRFATELRDEGLSVWCDRERVVQVLSNLVGNAIKFTPAGGSVNIVAETWGGRVRVAVRDDGPGIAPQLLPRIFDRYWHGATSQSRTGSGLGLYIAKGIIENHGGQIWVDSAPGRGSTFYFTLPPVAPMEAQASN
ncbi:MAG: Sensory box histidine kinase [Myxococcales bacterium]|nr:Sensory box histidine kinase [Myxococcales bacterium]